MRTDVNDLSTQVSEKCIKTDDSKACSDDMVSLSIFNTFANDTNSKFDENTS